jgi:RNA polymerase sigma factor (TIGR02999 family)
MEFRPEENLGQRKLDETYSLVYEQLRRLASLLRRNEPRAEVSSTTLVDEAWVKLRKSPQLADTSPTHFKLIAGKAMRQILVEEARRRGARKRGGSGEAKWVGIEESMNAVVSTNVEILDLDQALDELKEMSPRQAQVVESLFFGGMSTAETACEMGISEATVERDWRVAKAWLASRIQAK